eukprot:m.218344 g.218344  ORF g.218344 m.218344 type:complete len:1071 (+) comp33265_c0_seq3:88-3300(+)
MVKSTVSPLTFFAFLPTFIIVTDSHEQCDVMSPGPVLSHSYCSNEELSNVQVNWYCRGLDSIECSANDACFYIQPSTSRAFHYSGICLNKSSAIPCAYRNESLCENDAACTLVDQTPEKQQCVQLCHAKCNNGTTQYVAPIGSDQSIKNTEYVPFQCITGKWKITNTQMLALVCEDEPTTEATESVWLQDEVYYRRLRNVIPFGGALQLASMERYGNLQGHMATPLDEVENRIVTEMARRDKRPLYFGYETAGEIGGWIALRNVKDRVIPAQYFLTYHDNLRSNNIFGEDPREVFFQADTPQWNWVDGPRKGEPVWQGVCSDGLCCLTEQPQRCADLTPDGHALGNDTFTDWNPLLAPTADITCAAILPGHATASGAGVWMRSECTSPQKIHTPLQKPPYVFDARSIIVQFRQGYNATKSFDACGSAPVCECTSSLWKHNRTETTRDVDGNSKMVAFIPTVSASRIICKNLLLRFVPLMHHSARFDEVYYDAPTSDSRLIIDLSFNNITTVSDDHFASMTTLRKLDLRWNQLTFVPQFRQDSIELLDLRHNHITVMAPNSLFYLPNLNELWLGEGNPIGDTSKILDTINFYGRRLNFDEKPIGRTKPPTPTPSQMPTVTDNTTDANPIASRTNSDTKQLVNIIVSAVVAVCALLIITIVVVVFRRRAQRRSAIQKLRDETILMQTKILTRSKMIFYEYYRHLIESGDELAFEEAFKRVQVTGKAANIMNRKAIASGPFGVVYKASLWLEDNRENSSVAIKLCKPGDVAGSIRLLVEARVLLLLKHPAIVPMVALRAESLRPWLATSFLQNGDLQKKLRKLRLEQLGSGCVGESTFEVDLLSAIVSIGGALTYLERLRIVHGDVAARNVLVGNDLNQVFLADFGSALPETTSDGAQIDTKYSAAGVAVPFRWMAPEALLESCFSCKSDVYAFGVFMWECCTFGKTPFGALGHHEVQELLISGQRLNIPTMPSIHGLEKMMENCWKGKPSDRPTFLTLRRELGALLATKRALSEEQQSHTVVGSHIDNTTVMNPSFRVVDGSDESNHSKAETNEAGKKSSDGYLKISSSSST